MELTAEAPRGFELGVSEVGETALTATVGVFGFGLVVIGLLLIYLSGSAFSDRRRRRGKD
jgi:hypothetical protein